MEEQKDIQIPQPPDTPELPEEGFVPYCTEAEPDAAHKQNRRIRLLIVLIILVAAVSLFSVIGSKFNFYHKTLSTLQFDYRDGETVIEDSTVQIGFLANRLAGQIGQKQTHVQANFYLFDENNNLANAVSAYDYTHSIDKDELSVRSGVKASVISSKMHLRRTANGYEKQSGGSWKPAEDAYIPPLNAYFFSTENSEDFLISCYDTYYTYVGDALYTCEVWLMEDDRGAVPVYYTLYRYYSGVDLAAVRVLSDHDSMMEVYDITDYQIG